MGKRRKDKRRVFPSENIRRLETKEPANERQIIPKKQRTKKSSDLLDKSKFKKITEKGIRTHPTSRRSTVA
jgi:hypothetical protein